MCRKQEHCNVKHENKCVRQRKIEACQLIQLALIFGKLLCLAVHAVHSLHTVSILHRFVQSTDIFENVSSKLAGLRSDLIACISASLGDDKRQYNAHADEGAECKQTERPVIAADENYHNKLHQKRNADR